MARNIGRHAPGGFLLPFIFFVARVEQSETREVFAEHDRAESRSHRRFRRDAMVLGEVRDALYGMPRARNALRE
jgi:hypothetical protein